MSFTKKLGYYLRQSVDEHIITEEQKRDILKLVESDAGVSSVLKILSTLGAICIGIGVILIISSNWSSYGRFLQLIFALLLPLIPLIIGYYLYYFQKDFKVIGQAFILIGGVVIGGTIAIISQIYQIDAHLGYLFGVWGLMVAPLVYIFRFATLSALVTLLFYGSIFVFLTETFFTSWRNQDAILTTLIIISATLTMSSFWINKVLKSTYSLVFYPLFIISLKVLFFTLYIGTLDRSIMIINDSLLVEVIYNIAFLAVVGGTMFWANKNYEIILRQSTFFWIGLYIFTKYILLFSGYLQAGVFFLSTGIFIIALVYGLIKLNNYIKNLNLKNNEIQ